MHAHSKICHGARRRDDSVTAPLDPHESGVSGLVPVSVNLTEPVGVPDPELDATVALNVTLASAVDGLAEPLIVLVVVTGAMPSDQIFA